MNHQDLVLRAEKWLRGVGCSVVIRDPLRALTWSGETPDAIGWRAGISILVECKVSRADFLKDSKKVFRSGPNRGTGDWRFYLTPEGVAQVEDLQPGWGLLHAAGNKIKRVHGVPTNSRWGEFPNQANKRDETIILASALRRLDAKGYMDEVYKKERSR